MGLRRYAAVLATVLTALALSGCTPPLDRRPEPRSQGPARPMPYAKRRSDLPTGFPMQVPILDGRVTRAIVQHPGAVWLYDIETSLTVEAAATWYRDAYTRADWTVSAQSAKGMAGARAVTLDLRKGDGAESLVRVTPTKDARAIVSVAVGLGVPSSQ